MSTLGFGFIPFTASQILFSIHSKHPRAQSFLTLHLQCIVTTLDQMLVLDAILQQLKRTLAECLLLPEARRCSSSLISLPDRLLLDPPDRVLLHLVA